MARTKSQIRTQGLTIDQEDRDRRGESDREDSGVRSEWAAASRIEKIAITPNASDLEVGTADWGQIPLWDEAYGCRKLAAYEVGRLLNCFRFHALQGATGIH